MRRIGIDGYNLALPAGTGVASYARQISAVLKDGGHRIDLLYGVNVPAETPADLRETLFFGRLDEMQAGGPKPKLSLRGRIKQRLITTSVRDMVEIPVTGRVLAREFADRVPTFDRLFTRKGLFDVCVRYFRRYGRFLRVHVPDPPEIMHWTYPLPILLEGAANVYTIHDLVPLRLPHTSSEDKSYHHRLIAAIVAQAAHVCTVSQASRHDILDLFGADPERVTNTYLATGAVAPPADDQDAARWLRQMFDLDLRGYFLFYGAIEPKKNVGRLIQAYLEADSETPLLIVGRDGWRAANELSLLSGAHGTSLTGARRIRRIEYLPRPLLLRLIAGARAVLFPSLYEGFGLPVLEAMAAGTPVLTSNTSALPEVGGDAVIGVDPYDVSAIAQGIARLDRDPALRTALAQAGLLRAAGFSPEAFGKRLESAYEKAITTVLR